MEDLIEEYGELLMGMVSVVFLGWLVIYSLSEEGVLYRFLEYWGQGL